MSITLYENAGLPTTWPWYSWYNIYNDASSGLASGVSHNSMFLWEGGCRVNDGWNCTAACFNLTVGPKMVWGSANSTLTLQNCLIYEMISVAAGLGQLVQNPANLTEKYNIPLNKTYVNDTYVPGVVSNCLGAYCKSKGTPAEECIGATSFSPISSWQDGIAISEPSFCSWFDAPPDQDIGGVGVIISYEMLVIAVLVAWAVITVSTTDYITKFFKRRRTVKADSDAKSWVSRHTDVLTATLVELQKTQVFFMLTLQVASLVAMRDVGKYISATTWQEMYNNIELFTVIGASGIYPAVLNLFTLRKAKKASKYVVIATTFCVMVSMVTWIQSWRTKPSLGQIEATVTGLPACGNVKGAPTMFCQANDYLATTSTEFLATKLPYPLITLLVQTALLLEICKFVRDPSDNSIWCNIFVYGKKRWVTATPALQTSSLTAAARLVARGLLLVVDIWLVYNNCVMLGSYAYFLNLNTYSAWSLGQIIAVAVWIPVLVEYIYLLARGITKGFEYRVPKSYNVKPKTGQQGLPKADWPSGVLDQKSSYTRVQTNPSRDGPDSDEEMVPLSPPRRYDIIHPKTT